MFIKTQRIRFAKQSGISKREFDDQQFHCIDRDGAKYMEIVRIAFYCVKKIQFSNEIRVTDRVTYVIFSKNMPFINVI